eukprot:XP_012809794.1 PREDICTED: alpha-2-macroglobulin-like [Xenopus tropicalis]
MAYAFTLAGRMDIRHQLLQSLDEQAIKKDGTVHLHRPEFSDDSGVDRFPYRRAPSAEVEMNSYMLLALLSKPNVSDDDLTLATQVVSWMIKQQNPNGGFSSTQDTVVALQALSLYGSLTLSHDNGFTFFGQNSSCRVPCRGIKPVASPTYCPEGSPRVLNLELPA